MASMLFAYRGRALNPPICRETGWGTDSAMLRIDREIEKRGLEWWLSATVEEVAAVVSPPSNST